MKITDLRFAVLGSNPVVRITTDEGIEGYGGLENGRAYNRHQVLYYKQAIVGEDPTNVERVMLKIRRRGAFKPWGSGVSAIEIALWDIAGKAAGLPIHKLLGGKIRDRVRVYNGAVRFPFTEHTPKGYAENMRRMKEAPEGFSIIKQGISFHSQMPNNFPNFHYGDVHGGAGRRGVGGAGSGPRPTEPDGGVSFQGNRGLHTEQGLKYVIACVEAMKEVLGDEIGLALDCGPGWTVPDAIRLGKALEPLNVMWLEDMLTGDYTPYVAAEMYREVTQATSTPIHTGEQIYHRQNFKDLIEKHAVRVLGPDPFDIGGLAELKFVCEYADLHGLLFAPHGTADGVIGMAALVQVSATLPENYIAFEYPKAREEWWYEIVEGLPNPIVKDGFIEVWDTPGLGITFNKEAARKHLSEEDKDFFD
ncbi:MAG TPA: mandelate racemase/muconate lactonizing enzyme family protein [Chloroflexota bacterium]|nr:mandelate racemase/muconate lactonizing enzyme family protein [Chloroflexota bacterium]